MQSKKRSRVPYTYLIIAAVIIIGIFVVRAHMAGGDKPIIRTASVERGNVTATVSANGTLQPLTTVEVKSNVGGSIVKLAVDEGDTVKPGQLIARVDPTETQSTYDQSQADLAAAVSKVDQARDQLTMQHDQNSAEVASARHALASAKVKLLQAKEQARIQPSLTIASVKQAKSAYEAALANLDQTKTALVPQKLSAAQATYDQANASYKNADADYNRQKALLDKGYVAKSAVDNAEEKYRVAKATLDSAKNKLDTIKDETNEDLRSAEAKRNQSKADYDSAIANKVQDKVKAQEAEASQASVQQAQAALRVAIAAMTNDKVRQGDIVQANASVTKCAAAMKDARKQLGYTTIVAPRAGVVTKKYVEEGSIVTAGKASFSGTGSGVAIVDIADTSRMTALVDVDETDIAQIEVGQDVDITVEAYPDELFSGKVTKIAPQSVVDQNVTTIPVTVEVELPDARLKPGMNVTCDFITDKKQNVLMVPNEAVKTTDNDSASTVTVLGKNGEQLTRKVEVGLVGKDDTEIVSGLKEGQKVVTAVILPVKMQMQSQGSSSSMRGMGGMGGMGGGMRH